MGEGNAEEREKGEFALKAGFQGLVDTLPDDGGHLLELDFSLYRRYPVSWPVFVWYTCHFVSSFGGESSKCLYFVNLPGELVVSVEKCSNMCSLFLAGSK